MSEAAAAPKTCASCSKDVSRLPRTKDAKGRYLCQDCLARIKSKSAAAPAKPGAKPAVGKAGVPNDADVMGKLLADTPGVELCPNCGGGITVGSKICIRCGFNKETGRAIRVQVERAPREKGESKALAAAGAMAEGPMALILSMVGALIGGALGAGLWYAVAMNLNREIGWIAWGVGILCGLGAAMGARGHVGLFTGLIAAGVAAGAVMAGKYAVVENIVGQVERAVSKAVVADDSHAIALIARDVNKEFEAKGQRFQQPGEVPPAEAWVEEDFPTPVWTEANTRYEALDDPAKTQRKDQATAMMKREFQGAMGEARSEGFAAMFGPLDILFFFLAVASAFSIGAGAKSVGESFRGE